jgi:hypothetical protein
LGTLLKLHTSLLLVLGPRLIFASYKADKYKPGITSGPIRGGRFGIRLLLPQVILDCYGIQ